MKPFSVLVYALQLYIIKEVMTDFCTLLGVSSWLASTREGDGLSRAVDD